jgi:hypothetical protein
MRRFASSYVGLLWGFLSAKDNAVSEKLKSGWGKVPAPTYLLVVRLHRLSSRLEPFRFDVVTKLRPKSHHAWYR